jgi:uncharacterized protein
LDSTLAETYRKALKNSPNAESIKAAQREWLRNQRDICGDNACLKAAYLRHLNELKTVVNSSRTQDSTAKNEAKAVRTRDATETGKVEEYCDVGMWFYQLVLSNGKKILIGSHGGGKFNSDTMPR